MEIILGPIIHILILVIDLYMWVIIVNVILSWLAMFGVINTSNRFVFMVGDFCHRMTEPFLIRIRNFLPKLGAIDISPLVLILGLIFTKEILFRAAIRMG
ncbi:MAG: hypothetical protein CFH06_01083 [Alphaproteobacteria bacterium MarineAlpha3_Bin5]|nr:MAG: hypothetical protein CFH06_01083 [Alphaproteobacteria bacterium MarineAlpha3_Bin5]|tara:strand:- start:278 stop:577 length:300 start_codon:yes stop_codon:yes gene_type:complete